MSNPTASDYQANIVKGFNTFESTLNGHSQTKQHQVRKEAMAAFEKNGLPGAKHEEYKYTQLAKALQKNIPFSAGYTESTLAADTLQQQLPQGLDAYVLVYLNGKFLADASTLPQAEDTLLVKDLQEADELAQQTIADHFGQYADYEHDAFTALNTAFSLHGAFIQVPKGKAPDKPVYLLHVADTNYAQVWNNTRNLIVLGENSELSVIEHYVTLGNHESFTNTVSEVVLKKNARLQYHKIELDAAPAYHVGNTHIYQEAGSVSTAHTFTLGGQMVRNNLNITLDDEHCEANMNGLYLLNGKQHVDNHTMVDHRLPNSNSNELYKGVIDGEATGVFNGKIFVRQHAQKTNAYQSNRNLLLSDKATINTKPQLEIWADDVKCSHGATTGQLDEEKLFYLRTRGLDKKQARALLLRAFAGEMLEHIKLEPLQQHLAQVIDQKLLNLEAHG